MLFFPRQNSLFYLFSCQLHMFFNIGHTGVFCMQKVRHLLATDFFLTVFSIDSNKEKKSVIHFCYNFY